MLKEYTKVYRVRTSASTDLITAFSGKVDIKIQELLEAVEPLAVIAHWCEELRKNLTATWTANAEIFEEAGDTAAVEEGR